MNNINEKRKCAAPLELLLEFDSGVRFLQNASGNRLYKQKRPEYAANYTLLGRVSNFLFFGTKFTEFVP